MNSDNVVLSRCWAIMRLVFSVGWNESQNIYLFASLQVKGLYRSQAYPISNIPVAQQAIVVSSKPINQEQTKAEDACGHLSIIDSKRQKKETRDRLSITNTRST